MKRFIYFAVLLLTAACAERTGRDINSVLWVKTAAEYQSVCRQTYTTAQLTIDSAIADTRWTGALEQSAGYADLPPAVIFDLDETVLDTSDYQAKLALEGAPFDPSTWDTWVQMQRADPVAGAVDFIHLLQDHGIEPIFITNRTCDSRANASDPCPQESDTIENLKALGVTGISAGNLLLKNEYPDWGSEKKGRREYVAEKYRILMIFGDDLGDFIPDVKNNISPEKRKEMAEIYRDNWGTKWFILPNPMYGSWHQVLKTPRHQYLQDDQF